MANNNTNTESPKLRYTLKGWKKYIPFAQTYIDKQLNEINKLMEGKSMKDVRSLIYKHVTPYTYYDVEGRLKDALKHNVSDEPTYNPYRAGVRDDLFATYLSIPEDERRSSIRTIEPSTYKPTKGNVTNPYALILSDIGKDMLIQEALSNTQLGKNINSDLLSIALGTHTIGRGLDNKGEYVSYYDLWDLNPVDRYGGEDVSNGIGTPVDVYDRIYLDDYYDMPKNKRYSLEDEKNGIFYGGYLPEVQVIADKKKK